MSHLTQPAKRGLSGWKTRELLIVVVLAIVMGLITIPLRLATASLNVLFGPLASVPVSAYVVLGGCFVAYVVRRPLAAAISQLMVGLLLLLIVPGGFVLVALYVVHAIAIELPFAVTRYRRYGVGFMGLAGGIARLIILATAWVPAALSNLSIWVQMGLIVGAFLGGAAGGVLAKWLADSLAKAGVFSALGFDAVEAGETAV